MSSLKKDKIIIIIDNYRFDVTAFAKDHPGGSKILQEYHNKDATEAFNEVKGHCESVVVDLMDKCCIGKVKICNINVSDLSPHTHGTMQSRRPKLPITRKPLMECVGLSLQHTPITGQ